MTTAPIAGNYYNKYASRNPLVRLMMRHFMRQVYALINENMPQTLLDVGSGEGYMLSCLQQRFPGITVVASDVSRDILAEIPAAIPSVCCSANALPFADDSWDIVLACEVLEHLPDPVGALAELQRVARRGVILTVPLEPWWSWANLARGRYIRHGGNTPGHVQRWNKKTFMRLVTAFFKQAQYCRCWLWQCVYAVKQ